MGQWLRQCLAASNFLQSSGPVAQPRDRHCIDCSQPQTPPAHRHLQGLPQPAQLQVPTAPGRSPKLGASWGCSRQLHAMLKPGIRLCSKASCTELMAAWCAGRSELGSCSLHTHARQDIWLASCNGFASPEPLRPHIAPLFSTKSCLQAHSQPRAMVSQARGEVCSSALGPRSAAAALLALHRAAGSWHASLRASSLLVGQLCHLACGLGDSPAALSQAESPWPACRSRFQQSCRPRRQAAHMSSTRASQGEDGSLSAAGLLHDCSKPPGRCI